MEIREFAKKNGIDYREVLKKIKNRDKYHWNGRLCVTKEGVQLLEKTYKIAKKPVKARKKKTDSTVSMFA